MLWWSKLSNNQRFWLSVWPSLGVCICLCFSPLAFWLCVREHCGAELSRSAMEMGYEQKLDTGGDEGWSGDDELIWVHREDLE
jgi:hypothetical protein